MCKKSDINDVKKPENTKKFKIKISCLDSLAIETYLQLRKHRLKNLKKKKKIKIYQLLSPNLLYCNIIGMKSCYTVV